MNFFPLSCNYTLSRSVSKRVILCLSSFTCVSTFWWRYLCGSFLFYELSFCWSLLLKFKMRVWVQISEAYTCLLSGNSHVLAHLQHVTAKKIHLLAWNLNWWNIKWTWFSTKRKNLLVLSAYNIVSFPHSSCPFLRNLSCRILLWYIPLMLIVLGWKTPDKYSVCIKSSRALLEFILFFQLHSVLFVPYLSKLGSYLILNVNYRCKTRRWTCR